MKFRVYGPSIGNASNARVTRGVCEGLRACGVLEGHVPLDAFEEDESYPGAFAAACFFVGPYNLIGAVHHGSHERTFGLVQPNSTWMPQKMVDYVGFHSEPVAPSTWAKSIAETYWPDKLITVYPHGLEESFRPSPESVGERIVDYEQGEFRVLHLSSSMLDRKGTDKLVDGWKMALWALPDKAHLDLVIAEGDEKVRRMIGGCANISIVERFNASAVDMARIYQRYHLVVQPSRGEAFGMVAAEARASGVPIVVTACTGHSEWLMPGGKPDTDGAVIVPTGELCDIDDGPRALGPRLEAASVGAALIEAYEHWRDLQREALDWALARAERWSWPVVTRAWLKQIGG